MGKYSKKNKNTTHKRNKNKNKKKEDKKKRRGDPNYNYQQHQRLYQDKIHTMDVKACLYSVRQAQLKQAQLQETEKCPYRHQPLNFMLLDEWFHLTYAREHSLLNQRGKHKLAYVDVVLATTEMMDQLVWSGNYSIYYKENNRDGKRFLSSSSFASSSVPSAVASSASPLSSLGRTTRTPTTTATTTTTPTTTTTIAATGSDRNKNSKGEGEEVGSVSASASDLDRQEEDEEEDDDEDDDEDEEEEENEEGQVEEEQGERE